MRWRFAARRTACTPSVQATDLAGDVAAEMTLEPRHLKPVLDAVEEVDVRRGEADLIGSAALAPIQARCYPGTHERTDLQTTASQTPLGITPPSRAHFGGDGAHFERQWQLNRMAKPHAGRHDGSLGGPCQRAAVRRHRRLSTRRGPKENPPVGRDQRSATA